MSVPGPSAIVTQNDNSSRRDSLAISALLNEESVEPLHPCASYASLPSLSEKREHRKTWPGFFSADVSPISSFSPSPSLLGHSEEQLASDDAQYNSSDPPLSIDTPMSVDGHTTAKAKRKRISPQQYQRLMTIFEQTDTPSSEIRERLAVELGMTKREVQVWFQNRRAKASRAKAMAAAAASAAPPAAGYPSTYPINHRHSAYVGASPHTQSTSPHLFTDHITPAHHPPGYHPVDPVNPSQPHILPRPLQQLHPIAPMPPRPTPPYPTPAAIPRNTATNYIAPRRVYALDAHRRSGSLDQHPPTIHHAIANLSLRSAETDMARQPARKRPKSAIDLLASAAELVGSDELGK